MNRPFTNNPIANFQWPMAIPLLTLLFYHRLAFTNLILARGDTFLYFYPYWHAAAAALANGRVPLWNPTLFMGAPFLANSQVGFFYPLNWPLWLALPTPYAATASILLHVTIAALGAYLAGRRAASLSRPAALLTAVCFALGGYLSAQVEHINQLQGLAWFPWFWVALAARRRLATVAGVAALLGLQLLAGHTQTTFISGIAIGLWQLADALTRPSVRRLSHLVPLAAVAAGGVTGGALAAIQLLPTYELTLWSARQGGLPLLEVLSFSLHPLLLTRALLPAYEQTIFTEYVAVLPITVFLLGAAGVTQWRRRPAGAAFVVVVVALLFALGQFGPVYVSMAEWPLFNLFRAPARWLILYSWGMALLAGMGYETLRDRARDRWPDDAFTIALAVAVALMLWGIRAVNLAPIIPVGLEAPVEAATPETWRGWALEVGLLLFLWHYRARPDTFALLAIVVLFFTTRAQPFNWPTTPEAFFDQRPSTLRLQLETAGQTPDDRFLSLSNIFFDLGDQGEIDTIYDGILTERSLRDYIIAVKHKEVIDPNLPLVYDLPTVDGFDGGLLPLGHFDSFSRLLLPGGEASRDGRLREQLQRVPDPRWLDLLNVRYLITDKTAVAVVNGIFFDRQIPLALNPGESAPTGYLPDFEGTSLWLLAAEPLPVVTSDGRRLPINPGPEGVHIASFPAPATPGAIHFTCPTTAPSPCLIDAVTIVDARDNAFLQLVPGPYQRIHSGDVNIYENLDVLPRAYLLSDWEIAGDEAALLLMADPAFDPRTTAFLAPGPSPSAPDATHAVGGVATITTYRPERVVVQTSSPTPALLLLTDAWYPGWTATVDGRPTGVHRANILFRAVSLPAGDHEVVFAYTAAPYRLGLAITLAALLILTAVAWLARRRPPHLSS